MSSDARRVNIGTEPIEYRVSESSDATEPRIDVGIHETKVVIPEGSEIDPEMLLVENSRWVLERVRKYERYREMAPDRTFEQGEEFPYLGTPHKIVVEPRPESEVADSAFYLPQSHIEQSSIREELERLYRRNARAHLTEQVEHYASEMNVEYDGLELRNQRTRWGSCSSNGTLSFNWRLMMSPPDVIDYVVVHELAHLQEKNHTKRFWELVKEYIPDYKQQAEWLDRNSSKLIFDHRDL